MATWIVHLRIAENLLQTFPTLLAEEFAVGNIAPDSGIPDEKWEKFNPPGEVTHFRAPDYALYPMADLDFYQRYVLPLPLPDAVGKRESFVLGYFCHLVSDNLWHAHITEPARLKFKEQFEQIPGFIWEVKKDWYGLDFEYVRTHPDCLYWKVFMNCSYPENYLDFLLPLGVRNVIQHIQEYYQRTDTHAEERVNRQRIYLTADQVDSFVEQASRRLTGFLLKPANSFPTGAISMLEL
jgi:hypothetical protein